MKKKKINQITKRFKQLEAYMLDVDKRLEQLKIAQHRLNESENKLQSLQGNADDKISRLTTLISSNSIN